MPHQAFKLAAIVEKLQLPKVERLLRSENVTGWSVFPGGGKGAEATHPVDGARLVGDFAIVKVEAVLRSRETALRIAETLAGEVMREQPGIVWIETVEVIRAERF